MAGEWTQVAFSKLCDITRGASPRPIHDWFADVGIPWVKISDANSAQSRYITETGQYIKPEGRKKSVEVRPGDLILSNSATPGIPKFMGINACIHDGWLLLRNLRNLDKQFAYYLLLHERPKLVAQGNGSVFTNLKTEILKNHLVQLPPISEQRAIAHILGTLDDKIELNRRRNQTLEAMARALFKDWFVDFGPVRAKMEGRDPYLPADLWQLFPDRLDDEGKPEGWRRSTIGSEVTVCGGSTPSTKEAAFWESGEHHWATPKDLSALTFPVLLDTDRKITDAGIAKISSGLLPVGTVLLSSRAPIGYLAIAEVPTAINQGFIAMKCDGTLPNVFVLFWCRENIDLILGNANGSTFQEISKSNFRPIPVIVPSEPILNEFRERTGPLYRHIVENESESKSLAQLRDTLLPKLISGELRIPDAEKFIERAESQASNSQGACHDVEHRQYSCLEQCGGVAADSAERPRKQPGSLALLGRSGRAV